MLTPEPSTTDSIATHMPAAERLRALTRHLERGEGLAPPSPPPPPACRYPPKTAGCGGCLGASSSRDAQKQHFLTAAQKSELYHKGFVILRNVVPREVVVEARRRIAAMDRESTAKRVQAGLGGGDDLMLLLTESPALQEAIADLNGSFDDGGEWRIQPAITPSPAVPVDPVDISPVVAFSRGLHVDGRRPNSNDSGPAFIDAANTVSIRPFQNFVFVSCSDQRERGRGQTHLLPAGHIAMEEFFRWQLRVHGKVGSHECEGWGGPRDWPHTGIPTMVRSFYNRSAENSDVAFDGQRWPRPVPLLLGPGDACISSFSIPHTASKNELGTPREQIIFRFLPNDLQGGKGAVRGAGEQLDDETEEQLMDRIRAQLTDCWRGWDGMAAVVKAERPATEQLRCDLQQWFAQHGSTVTWDE